ncbi:glycosyltransferase [Stutzerimonas tarimensis]|uniref:Glycosyltransferase n=1 Tax=Stutzerimonas tarimensis TaxID=1507735 RepID=A0ABV7T933_9GAMM
MPRFSIVTLNWNNLAGLQATQRSLASQRHRDFRWIVVDGASSDGSAEWLAQLDFAPLELLSERDKGIYDAMAKGRAMAVETSGYTLFLGSGDCLADSGVLERVAAAIEAAAMPPALVYGDFQRSLGAHRRVDLIPARPLEWLPLGVPTALQSMYFENSRLASITFRPQYKLSANYCLLIEFLEGLDHRTNTLRLRSSLSQIDRSGVSQQRRFDALKEDMQIRLRFLALPWPRVLALYLLHYIHAHAKLAWVSLGLAPSRIDRMIASRVVLRHLLKRDGP